ncbi:MAG: SDR family oxidoreductase [Acidobacteriota bacterium]
MLDRKVVVVTGASRGIGAHVAERFAGMGYRVVINFRQSEEAARGLLEAITRIHGPGRAITIRADVSSRCQVQQMFDQTVERFGGVDVLVAMAGVNRDGPFLEMSDDQWEAAVSPILTGTFICAQEFARRHLGVDGHIVTIGALSAFRGRRNGANYVSARAGVMALTKCLAQELAPRIRVNCISPGYIGTGELVERYRLDEPDVLSRTLDMIPLRRIGTPEDVFLMIEHLVCGSTYVTGQNFIVDGGYYMR